jgi:hypothetical protein
VVTVYCGGVGASCALGNDVETEGFSDRGILEDKAWFTGIRNNTDWLEGILRVFISLTRLEWVKTYYSATPQTNTQ